MCMCIYTFLYLILDGEVKALSTVFDMFVGY
jgi:hypothetical protein